MAPSRKAHAARKLRKRRSSEETKPLADSIPENARESAEPVSHELEREVDPFGPTEALGHAYGYVDFMEYHYYEDRQKLADSGIEFSPGGCVADLQLTEPPSQRLIRQVAEAAYGLGFATAAIKAGLRDLEIAIDKDANCTAGRQKKAESDKRNTALRRRRVAEAIHELGTTSSRKEIIHQLLKSRTPDPCPSKQTIYRDLSHIITKVREASKGLPAQMPRARQAKEIAKQIREPGFTEQSIAWALRQ